jgi:hypothetical protein
MAIQVRVRLKSWVWLLLLAALAVVAVACGGREPLSLEEYFQRLEEIRADAFQRMVALEEEFEEVDSASTDEEQIDEVRRFLDGSASSLGALVDDLEGLDPPAEVEGPHDDLVQAESDRVELIRDLADRLEDVESRSELEDVFDESEDDSDEVEGRLDAACLALQDLADEKDIDVDLECAGDLAQGSDVAIQVEDTHYRLDYFASRLKMYVDLNGGPGVVQPSTGLGAISDLLIQEEIVRLFASEFDIEATEDEVREEIASRLGITVDDASFDVVFQQELARSDLSETGYKDMVEAAVLTDKLRDRFLEDVPEAVASVHYRQILVSEQGTAVGIRDEIEGGADFAALAAENSLDAATKDNGGDVGWLPRDVQDASTEELLFALEVGEITIIPVPAGVLVIEILEKDDDHPVEEGQREPLAARLFDEWVQDKQQPPIEVQNFVLSDNDKCSWALRQAYGVDIECGI